MSGLFCFVVTYFCVDRTFFMMMKMALVFAGFVFITTLSAQVNSDKLVIDKKLSWSDFTGEVDKSSEFSAMTYWSVNYSYQAKWAQSDTAYVTFSILPRFENKSWVKKNFESAELLRHEQGHYDLAVVCAETLRENFASYIFFKSSYQNKIDSIFQSTLQLVKQIELQYDAETNHMLNRDEQAKWNDNIARLLARLPAISKENRTLN